MVKYEVVEIHENEYLEVMKCVNFSKEERHNTSTHSSDTYIVIIPGNPGLIEFYEQYATYLHNETGLPVIGISHTGHIGYGVEKSWDKSADLNQQITDKLKYIKEYVIRKDRKLNLILIGHSVGCHIILEIMAHLNKETYKELNVDILKAILLFPTIEQMRKTPQGRRVTPILNNLLTLTLCICYLVSLIPVKILHYLVSKIFRYRPNPDCIDDNVVDTVFKMVKNYNCLKSILVMAKHEMRQVGEFDKFNDIFKTGLFKNKILLYYGQNDHWCPVEMYWEMKDHIDQNCPNLVSDKITILDDYEMDHAFVIFKNQVMVLSKLTVDWIEECMGKLN